MSLDAAVRDLAWSATVRHRARELHVLEAAPQWEAKAQVFPQSRAPSRSDAVGWETLMLLAGVTEGSSGKIAYGYALYMCELY